MSGALSPRGSRRLVLGGVAVFALLAALALWALRAKLSPLAQMPPPPTLRLQAVCHEEQGAAVPDLAARGRCAADGMLTFRMEGADTRVRQVAYVLLSARGATSLGTFPPDKAGSMNVALTGQPAGPAALAVLYSGEELQTQQLVQAVSGETELAAASEAVRRLAASLRARGVFAETQEIRFVVEPQKPVAP